MRVFLLGVWACAVCVASIPTVALNNGVDMPVIAFAANVWDAETCKTATLSAIKSGFNFIWSSVLIGQACQSAQGDAIRDSGVIRSDLFVAGTVNTASCSDEAGCYTQSLAAGKGQLSVLGLDHLDLLMLDYPASSCDAIKGQWRALTELHTAKSVRTIAVSNFNLDQLKCVSENATTPAVNQMSYSVGHGTDTVVADDAALGIVVQAYSPLGGGELVNDPLLKQIGSTHNKSAAQVALRWILQRNATIATQATEVQYLQQDLDIFNFELTSAEMQQLNVH